jgi:hypothetical protein
MKTVTFNITTTAGGAYDSSTAANAATVTGQRSSTGSPYLLYAVEWVDTDFDAGVDAVLSVTSTPSGADLTLLTLTNADNEVMYYPRHDAHTNAGAAIVDGASLTGERVMPIVDGTLKLVVSAGGATKTGKCLVYLQGC